MIFNRFLLSFLKLRTYPELSCAAFLIPPIWMSNGVSSTYYLEQYIDLNLYCTEYNYHSLVGYSTDSNPFDLGSNLRPELTFLLNKSVIYWYHISIYIFLINNTLLLFFHVVLSVLDAALYIGV